MVCGVGHRFFLFHANPLPSHPATMADEADTLPLPRRDFDEEQARVLALSKQLIKR